MVSCEKLKSWDEDGGEGGGGVGGGGSIPSEGRQIDTRATSLPRGRAVTARHDVRIEESRDLSSTHALALWGARLGSKV